MPIKKQPIVLVGLMGSGKTRVGMALARLLKRPFIDSDKEIEIAAGMPITDIFAKFGESYFRAGEKKVMLRLLEQGECVIATGGGAFIQDDIRAAIKKHAFSIWLKADVETLVERTSRTDHRPLLRGVDKTEKLSALVDARYPVYAEADLTVDTDGGTPQDMARVIKDKIAEIAKE